MRDGPQNRLCADEFVDEMCFGTELPDTKMTQTPGPPNLDQ